MKLSQLNSTVTETMAMLAPKRRVTNDYCHHCLGTTRFEVKEDGSTVCLVCGVPKPPKMRQSQRMNAQTMEPTYEDKEYHTGTSIGSGPKQKNVGAGVQFCQKSNKEGYEGAAAKHPGNTIMSQVPQTTIKFGGKKS